MPDNGYTLRKQSPRRVYAYVRHRCRAGRNKGLVEFVPKGVEHDAHQGKERPSPLPSSSRTGAKGPKEKQTEHKVFKYVRALPDDSVNPGYLLGAESRKKEAEHRAYDRERVLCRERPGRHKENKAKPQDHRKPKCEEIGQGLRGPSHPFSIGYAGALCNPARRLASVIALTLKERKPPPWASGVR